MRRTKGVASVSTLHRVHFHQNQEPGTRNQEPEPPNHLPLTGTAGFSKVRRSVETALVMRNNSGQVKGVARMLQYSPFSSRRLSRWAISLLVLVIGAAGVWGVVRSNRPRPAVAQQGPRRPAPTRQTTRPSAGVPVRQASDTTRTSPSARDVVAVVNSEAITRQQLAQECLRRYGEDMLESMVNKQLILSACREKGIEVTAEDIDQEIRDTAAKVKVPVDQFLKMLEQEQQHARRKVSPRGGLADVVLATSGGRPDPG